MCFDCVSSERRLDMRDAHEHYNTVGGLRFAYQICLQMYDG